MVSDAILRQATTIRRELREECGYEAAVWRHLATLHPCIGYADEHIGTILEALDDLGVLDETIVIVSADHGESQGEFNVWGDHQTADHSTCRVPLVIRWPGRFEGGRLSARDIASLGAALLGPRVFGDRGRAEMFRDVRLADGSATGFALGLRVGSHGTSRLLHLPGGGVGISSWLFIHPDEALVVALLANVNTAPVGGRTHRLIADAFLRAR